MKHINSLFLAAVMLLFLGVQNAGAWGFKAEGWTDPDGGFTSQTYYTDGYETTEAWDIYAVQFEGAKTWFTLGQDVAGTNLTGQQLGFSDFSPALSNQTVVRASAKWTDPLGMYSNFTVILPDGNIWIVPNGAGSGILMTKKNAFMYEAIVSFTGARTVSLYGADITATQTEYNDFPSGGKPGSLKLQVLNVPVNATENLVKVTYNLKTNQVTSENAVSEICDWAWEPAYGTACNGVDPSPSQEGWVLFSWETVANGNVEITIKPHPDNVAADNAYKYAVFRGNNGMATSGFSLNNNLAFGTYFTKTISTDKKKVILTPIQIQTIPAGTTIKFSGLIEYKTNEDTPSGDGNNLWPSFSFNSVTTTCNNTYAVVPAPDGYTYGTNCTGVYSSKLDAPTDVAVDNDNILTFTPVADAEIYIVKIYAGTGTGTVLVKTVNVDDSGNEISFALNGNFTVTVTAEDSDGVYTNSDASTPADWTNSANINIIDLPLSIYCGTYVSGGNGGNNFTVETDENGDIKVTLNGSTYRAAGINVSGWIVAGVNGILTKVSGVVENPQVFRPISGVTIPKGTLISYNGTVEWNAGTYSNGTYNTGTFFTNYVYGTTCAETTPPEILSAEIIGDTKAWGVSIEVNAIDNIGVAQIKLIDEENSYEQTLPAKTPNGTATYLFNGLTAEEEYNFSVIAFDLAGNSDTLEITSSYTTPKMPEITIENNSLSFSRYASIKTFILSGENIASDMSLSVPAGYTVEPEIFSPINGLIPNTTVTVTWINGLGNHIAVSGGGLENPLKIVDLTYTDFSEYCSYVITQGGDAELITPALVNISINEDSTTLIYTIAPYDITGDATWNGGALHVERFLINGNAPTSTLTRQQVDAHTITINFNTPLTKGDIITYTPTGATLVWTTSGYTNYGNNVNCYIDAWNKTFIVGENNCDIYPYIANAEYNLFEIRAGNSITELADTYADIWLNIKSTHDIASVTFEGYVLTAQEQAPRLRAVMAADIDTVFTLGENMPVNKIFKIEDLTAETSYRFDITVVDNKNNQSQTYELSFTTLAEDAEVTNPFIITETSTISTSQIYLFPNPATDILYISGVSENENVRIFDISGRTVSAQMNNGAIDVSSLSNGIYMLQAGGQVMKFVKK
ncbi:MAG: T9SS type A sorting domain-containing protein [Prevotellaceae bacterium]|jgi:hypothetical protein|nr:T9SS type A sorting domain-containing protein [Prevotellaceae bacterium]